MTEQALANFMTVYGRLQTYWGVVRLDVSLMDKCIAVGLGWNYYGYYTDKNYIHIL